MPEDDLKRCNCCQQLKSADAFTRRRASPDGLNYTCRACASQRSAHWRREHPTAHAEWYRTNREHKRAYYAQWRTAHRDHLRQTYKQWAQTHPARINANIATNTARKTGAAPPWVDIEPIHAIYAEAHRLTCETGVPHEVDHIVPLKNPRVCGLHVAWNLQVLTRADNQRKQNKLITPLHTDPARTPPAAALPR